MGEIRSKRCEGVGITWVVVRVAAGINGYDGLDLNIEIVEDDACGVLFDLMAGSIEDPLEQTNGARRAGAAPSLVRSFAHHHDHCCHRHHW